MTDKTLILEKMIGNTYEYEGRKHLIYEIRTKGNIASLVTDKDVIELPLDGLDDYLDDFVFIKSNQLIKSPEILEMVTSTGSVYGQLQTTLLDSIEKIKSDKNYVEQAQAINETVKQIIDMEKVKIQTLQLLK